MPVVKNAIDNAKLHKVSQEAGNSDKNTADRNSNPISMHSDAA